MGITGLLPFLEKASKKSHLSEFKGCTVAVDTYCWLHRGAFSCAEKLARGEETDLHIQYCLKYINLLTSYHIKPILVFDGKHLSAKELTEAKRRETRKNAKKRAVELLKLGKASEARNFLRRCVDITHEMALCLIKECRKRNIDCIVAPYEADAQLAFLNIQNIAHIVITEDSDLTLFGCSKILFKLDLQGNGTLVDSSKLYLAMDMRPERYTFDKFRYMCILSGCDYLESLPGIGLMKACKFIKLTEDPDIYRALLRIPNYLNMKNLVVPEEYRDGFMKADATFKHMLVYNPLLRKIMPLTDPFEIGTDVKYCCDAGESLDNDIAFQLALGNLDPFTMKTLDNWNPDSSQKFQTSNSIWSKSFKFKNMPERVDVKKVTFPTTFGKSLSVDSFKLAKKINNDMESEPNSISIDDLAKIYTRNKSKSVTDVPNIIVEDSQLQSPTKNEESSNANTTLSPLTPKKSRNPFAKTSNKDPCEESPKKLYENNPEITSPVFKMKLTKRTSLIKSVSSPQKSAKRKRLSGFSTTSMSSENVVSKFFKPNQKDSECDKISQTESISDDEVFNSKESVNDTEKDVLMMDENEKSTDLDQSDVVFVEDSQAISEADQDKSNELDINLIKKHLMTKYSVGNTDKNLEKSQSVSLPVHHSYFKNNKVCRDIFKGLVNSNENLFENQKITNTEFKNPVCVNSDTSSNSSNAVTISDDEDTTPQGSTNLSQPLANLHMVSDMKKILKKSFSEKIIFPKPEDKKSSCRRLGLSKHKVSTTSSGQSRLSMYGFTKKEQLSLH